MAAVTAYQDGIYEDMIPLAYVELPRMLGRSKCRVDLKDPALNTAVKKIHNVVSPWLDTFGDSRLAKLFECIQNAKMLLALEAIFNRDTVLLEVLHNAFDVRSFRGNSLLSPTTSIPSASYSAMAIEDVRLTQWCCC
ncbi:hypothetical protein AC1031_005604 [Aphanomyces cochlioides]|nr:hypothetical protein AC1031_005604 [Aphanomyces cochlioides]